MPDGAVIDTDVLLKTAAFRLANDMVDVLLPRGTPAALGLTHLIADKQLQRKRGVRDLEGARAELCNLLARIGSLEPNDEEISIAAKLASEAQLAGLPLDAGEAQLVAIVANRGLPLLLTGDKRALTALAALIESDAMHASLLGRLACFEQAIRSVANVIGEHEVRARVCAEPEADTAMGLACSCGREPWNPTQLHEACASFSNAVRAKIGDLMVAGSALT